MVASMDMWCVKMTALIAKVINEVTTMIKALERQGAALVTAMIQYSEKAAVTLEAVLKDAFDKVKRTLAMIARQFKEKLKALEQRAHPAPSNGNGFTSKIKTAAHDAAKEIELVVEKMVNVAKEIAERSKEIILKLGKVVERTVVDAGKYTADAIKETFKAIKTISEKAVKEVKTFVEGIDHSISMDASFVHKHGLEMSTVTSIALFDPVLIASFAISAGAITAAAMYNPLPDDSKYK